MSFYRSDAPPATARFDSPAGFSIVRTPRQPKIQRVIVTAELAAPPTRSDTLIFSDLFSDGCNREAGNL
ncbi:MAG: hypothetical protein ABIR80_14315 [Opitutaceae bacterium]